MQEVKKVDAATPILTLEQAIKEIEEINKRLKRVEDEMIRIKQGRRWV